MAPPTNRRQEIVTHQSKATKTSGVRSASESAHGRRAREFFGLTPEIVAVSTSMFLLGCGENLWRRFLPKYLESLGAPIAAIGLFGTAEDFLDGVYQYPGGDRKSTRLNSCH